MDTEGLSDEVFDFLCSVCKRKGKNKEAEKYCVDCNNYFCLSCHQVHDDFLSLAGHKVLDKEQFKNKIKPVTLIPTERCERHGHKLVDMYCQDHGDVGCATCMAIEHRICQDTFYIPEFIQETQWAPSSNEIKSKLELADKGLSEQLENLKLEKQQLLDKKTNSLQEVKDLREKINQRLDELEQNTIADIEDKFRTLITEIEERMGLLQASKDAVSSANDKLRLDVNNVSQVFVSVKKGENVVKDAEKHTDECKANVQVQDIEVIADETIFTALNEVKGIGSVKSKVPLLQAKNRKLHSVKLASDMADCGIVSTCALEDGRIVVSDYHNKKLKCVDNSTFEVIDYIELPERPWQVCPVGKQEVAVGLQTKKEVQFICLSGKMMKKSKIRADIDCYALAYAANSLYIASDRDDGVYMYSVFGRKLKVFCSDLYGEALFSDIYSLAVKEDGSRICVANWEKGLIVLDRNGQVVWRYNGSALKNAYGCYLPRSGGVLVCGYSSNNVLQFGGDGELIGEVLKSSREDRGCQTVCFSRGMSKMIVSREQNELEVYDLH